MDEGGSSGRGTVSTYIRALDVLSMALQASKSARSTSADVWGITSPDELMDLRSYVIGEQEKFNKNSTGIFAALSGGRCYYTNRWCSAALKKLAMFRQTNDYIDDLNKALAEVDTGVDVARKAARIKMTNTRCFMPDDIDPASREGRDVAATAKRRINQSVFRSWIISIYGTKCCVTGLNVPEILRASHIVEWAKSAANRMNPSNGLCLSATYDTAFDRHLISFDDDYRMILSKRISDFCSNRACRDYFKAFEGKRISLPVKFLPDKSLLAKHRELLVS